MTPWRTRAQGYCGAYAGPVEEEHGLSDTDSLLRAVDPINAGVPAEDYGCTWVCSTGRPDHYARHIYRTGFGTELVLWIIREGE